MIWYKAWLETRSRLAWSFFVLGSMVFLHLASAPQFIAKAALDPDRGRFEAFVQSLTSAAPHSQALYTAEWQIGFLLISTVIAPTMGLLMAGSGINTQTFYGMRQGVHPSMIFTLSLPVRRGQWLLTRGGLGAIQTAILALLLVCIPPALTPGSGYSWKLSLVAWPFLTLGTMVFYWFSVFVATFLDELWQGLVSLTIIGALGGIAISGFGGGIGWIKFLIGGSYLLSGSIPWGGILLSLVLSGIFFYASVAVIERREF